MKTLPLLLKKSLCSGILFIKISLIISNISQIESKSNKCFSLNVKGLRISFSRSGGSVDHITINHKQIEVVSSAKLLAVVVSDNLRWNAHVQSICKKVATRLYFLKQLRRAQVPTNDMLLFYTTCIRPVLEYACPVFHYSLPQYLANEKKRLQRRALRIILPDLSFAKALVALDIMILYERTEAYRTTELQELQNYKNYRSTRTTELQNFKNFKNYRSTEVQNYKN